MSCRCGTCRITDNSRCTSHYIVNEMRLTESIRNFFSPIFFHRLLCLIVAFVLIPGTFYFELFIVLPQVVAVWSIWYWLHSLCALFLLLNIVGNMIYCILTHTTIKGKILQPGNKTDWTFCVVCETMRPPRAWHCDMCNICVLKRDHHCAFLACCVGYYNQRYFVMFTMYIFIAMVYAFYFNMFFVSQHISWIHGIIVIMPLASFFIGGSYLGCLYMYVMAVNFAFAAFSGFLTYYHIKNILKGRIVAELKYLHKDFSYDRGWKNNVVDVFGTRWYFVWILPFIYSPLPGNGIDWPVGDKNK